MRISSEQLASILKRPAIAKANHPPGGKTPCPYLEQGSSHELHRKVPPKKADPDKCRISFTDYRVRLADCDGCCHKYHLDALRYLGVIEDDTVAHVELVIHPQVKVKTKAEQRTEIQIEFLWG